MFGGQHKLLTPAIAVVALGSGGQSGYAQEADVKLMQLLRAEIAAIREIRESLSGAVVAFDTATGCPAGWEDFEPGAGRFIVGIDGAKYKLPYVAGEPDYQTGGQERVELTKRQIPNHTHSGETGFANPIKKLRVVHGAGSAMLSNHVTGFNGNFSDVENKEMPGAAHTHDFKTNVGDDLGGERGQSHENVPPYIALYLCRKCGPDQKTDPETKQCIPKEAK